MRESRCAMFPPKRTRPISDVGEAVWRALVSGGMVPSGLRLSEMGC